MQQLNLTNDYTSTGSKFFYHQSAMENLRNGKGQPIVTHVMLTDVCQHTCAFCSVQARAGDSLEFNQVIRYLDTLKGYGLKAVILSGGGNPILYKCKKTNLNFNDVVDNIHAMDLEIGLITNGMPLREYYDPTIDSVRESWRLVSPSTLDKLTWIRISMAGLDHSEEDVYVPDVDYNKTTLGFSYVAHDIYNESEDKHHGKVSTRHDLLSGDKNRAPDKPFEMRMSKLTRQISTLAYAYKPSYIRLLPNCLEPELIEARCRHLRSMAHDINTTLGRDIAFVQYKPPSAPKACYLGYVHPVLNCDGYVYPCDSCVLNQTANHQFANPWRICRWDEITQLYEKPVRSLIANPGITCPGCVFPKSNELLRLVVEGDLKSLPAPSEVPTHPNFI